MLSEDTYFLVEHPRLKYSAGYIFGDADGAAWRFTFYMSDEPGEYPELNNYRRTMLGYVSDFLNSSEMVLKELPTPFGLKQCQLMPEELLPEVENAQVQQLFHFR